MRDALAGARRDWLDAYRTTIDRARDLGQLASDVDAPALAFELDALGMAANLYALLCDDPSIYDQARTSMLGRLRAVVVDAAALPSS